MDAVILKRLEALDQEMQALGWRRVTRRGQRAAWEKFYPPPHDVPHARVESLTVLARGSGREFRRDLERSREALIADGRW